MIKVDTWPYLEAATASAKSGDNVISDSLVLYHPDTVPARDSIFMLRGASALRCHVACSPIKFNKGVLALRALWRLAMPLAKPGPRWSKVRAGLSSILP